VKLFVTGATGVIGRRVVPQLVKRGYKVSAAVRSAQKIPALELVGAQAIALNLFDQDALRRALAGCEVVINLATHIPRSSLQMLLPGAWRENDRIRTAGSANLVDAAIAGGVKHLIQESFAPVYVDCASFWIDEETRIAPVRYNRTVQDAERSARRFSESGATGIVLRFAQFYGHDAVQTRDTIKFVRKGWAPMPGAGEAYVSSVSHDDAAGAVVAALDAPAGIYNVVDDEPLTHREYFAALAAALGTPSPKLPPPWMWHLFGSLGEMLARSQRISNRKLKRETGWAPQYASVREGWRAVVAALQREQELARNRSEERI
jgi:2-alkyl-3-oxoalkanoate reductase